MKARIPIFVPSKGRAKTSKFLKRYGSQVTACFVEPQEIQVYEEAFPCVKFISIERDNKGIAYVRNFILEHAIERQITSYWMFDDDVSEVKNGKTKEVYDDLQIPLHQVFDDFRGLIWGQLGLEYQQFAWATRRHARNSYCDVAVAINAALCAAQNIRYRDFVNGKEDRDFTMQILRTGFATARHADICFAAPKNGSNAGGLSEWYAGGERERACTERMIQLWGPEICSLNIKKDGRPDCKINWKALRERSNSAPSTP